MHNPSQEALKIFSSQMKNVVDFERKLDDISKKWDQLILLSELSSTKIDLTRTKRNFNDLNDELIENLTEETLKKVINDMTSKAQVTVDIVIRNLFERTADIGFLATDDDIRKFLTEVSIKNLLTSKDEILKLKNRFNEYVSKYSVYYDILLFDLEGNILIKLDDANQTIFKSKDSILNELKNTKKDYLETYKYHDFLPNKNKSLVYSYKVTKENNSDEIIGYLALCFKFKDELQMVFENLIDKKNKEVLLLLDKNCNVIASSDLYHIPLDAPLEIELNKPFGITQFAGRDYIIKTCETNGYEGFYGLGWYGHIMIPIESAFNIITKDVKIEDIILNSMMKNEKLFKKELISIPQKAELIQEELDRAVWNGNIRQVNSTSTEGDFSRLILKEIKSTGENTKTTFAKSIESLNQTVINSLLDNVTFLATLTIDILDRNFYERANDCRWWALTSAFKHILKKDDINTNNINEITNILKYINNLYTVYSNLFIYDETGTIIAVSNDNCKSIINTRLKEKWIDNTLKLRDSSKYYVSYFDKTFLYDNEFTFVFNAAINDEEKNLGGIGIVFDCSNQFHTMLNDALPKDNDGNTLAGYTSMFVEKNYGAILGCSDDSHNIGDILEISDEFIHLKRGESISKIIEYRNKYYLLGARCSKGYREFKSEDDTYQKEVFALVFLEIGNILENNLNSQFKFNNFFSYDNIESENDIEELATFYIGKKWLGVRSKDIVEATHINNLEKPISMDSTEHYFKGTIIHKKLVISVLDIGQFIQESNSNENKEMVIIKYKGNENDHTIGLVVSKLGEMIVVPKRRIKPFERHFIGGGMLGESIVQPPENSNVSSLLTLLNIEKLDSLGELSNSEF